jgi:hypothetical protein
MLLLESLLRRLGRTLLGRTILGWTVLVLEFLLRRGWTILLLESPLRRLAQGSALKM